VKRSGQTTVGGKPNDILQLQEVGVKVQRTAKQYCLVQCWRRDVVEELGERNRTYVACPGRRSGGSCFLASGLIRTVQ